MKRLLFTAAGAILLSLSSTAFAAEAPGIPITYYNVSAYINNYPIPCYNINNYCGIYVKDLADYGFCVDYDAQERVVRVTRDTSVTQIYGKENVLLPYQASGTLHSVSGSSDIRVFVNGAETVSYWVDGSMMILLDSVASFGSYDWDNDKCALFVDIPDISKTEYEPLKKAMREYTRVKHSADELAQNDYSVYPNEERNWGFQRVENDEPILYSWEKTQLEKYGGFYIDQSKPHILYFTFDEGYEAGYTPQILEVLKKYDIPATFFVTGEYLDSSPHLVRRMLDEGFSVGNHTSSHPNLAHCGVADVMNEIQIVSDRLKNDFGYNTYYLRPPEGAFSERVLAIARDMGYNTILWSFAYKDYDTSDQKGTDYAYDMMTRYMHDGAIYLIHAVSKDNANALESVILYAKEHGYKFSSLDDLCKP